MMKLFLTVDEFKAQSERRSLLLLPLLTLETETLKTDDHVFVEDLVKQEEFRFRGGGFGRWLGKSVYCSSHFDRRPNQVQDFLLTRRSREKC